MDAQAVKDRYDPNKPLIHFHVVKTAGTSFRSMLLEWFGDRRFYTNSKWSDDMSRSIITDHFLRQFRSDIVDKFPDKSQYVTFLREPFAQLVSFYFYWKEINPENVLHIYGVKIYLKDVARNFEEFIRNNPLNFNDYLPPGTYPTDLLDFGFVGIQDEFPLCMKAFENLYGLPHVPYQHHLVTDKKSEQIDPSLREVYKKLHPEYFEQYEFVVEHWSPIWRQLANETAS